MKLSICTVCDQRIEETERSWEHINTELNENHTAVPGKMVEYVEVAWLNNKIEETVKVWRGNR